jgi:outer membrane protein assembly factor BamA
MPAMEFYYERADGILYFLGAQYLNEATLHPFVRAMRGWTSAREADYYQVDFEQPFHTRDSFSLGVSFYDRTGWSREDDEAVTDFGNNLRTIVARTDHRDYFERRGVTLFANWKAAPHVTLRLEHREDNVSSLSTQESVWSLFRRSHDWRENPPLTVGIGTAREPFDGRVVSYVGSFVYDDRSVFDGTGWLARGFFEFGGGPAGGDVDFRKDIFELSRSMRLTETQTLDLLGRWGIGSGARFPSWKMFYLGGIENLRGYDRKSIVGRNMLFGRADYGVQMTKAFKTFFFVDTGAAWFDRGDVPKRFKSDFGVGFRFDAPTLGDARIDVARAMTSESADIFVDFQLYY